MVLPHPVQDGARLLHPIPGSLSILVPSLTHHTHTVNPTAPSPGCTLTPTPTTWSNLWETHITLR